MSYQARVVTKQATVTPAQRAEFLRLIERAEQATNHAERESLLRRAAAASPESWASIGSSFLTTKQKRAAFQCFREALEFVPPEKPHVRAVILTNIGTLLSEFGDRPAAMLCFLEANELFPHVALIEGNIALSYKWQNNLDEALRWIDKTIRSSTGPEIEQAVWTKSLILLTAGRLKEGWALYGSRFKNPASKVGKAKLDKPEWVGQCLDGKYLFVYSEQGHGDTFQFIRYLKLLKDRWPTVRVCFGAQIGQGELLSTIPYIDQVIEVGQPIPQTSAVDYSVALISLPGIMRTNTVADIPWFGPYIPTPEPLQLSGAFKVGVCWAGSPDHGQDIYRSTSLDIWGPILSVPGCAFYSLVSGMRTIEAADEPRVATQKPANWLDTARLIAGLDLVISVDTGPVHLAGAMGKPVWMLTQFCPDFRWMLQREDSPWYPSIRLFRQELELEWEPVVARVASELRQLIRS